MSKNYTNNYIKLNLYKKKSLNSEIVTQLLYGEDFKIIKKENKWWKIKIKKDRYIGYIKKKKFIKIIKATHKIHKLYANIYSKPNKRNKIGKLSFNSKIKVKKSFSHFVKFENKWIDKNDIKPINFENKNIFQNIKIFKGVKYKWGGNSYKGIDCSALIQIFFNFNNKYCPRDTKDQLNYFKRNIQINKIKKNDIIYWKGHVALVLSKKNLIHAYGPSKKTVIMNVQKTIKLINKTANLEVINIKRI
ncbi:MAG: NlpC/P60 family protein [Pelagibacteraceae bacterium]